MLITDILSSGEFEIVSFDGNECEVSGILCSDVHSYALHKLQENNIWITVTSHINTLAVAKQKNAAAIIIADIIRPDEEIINAAVKNNITIFLSRYPVYETAVILNKMADT